MRSLTSEDARTLDGLPEVWLPQSAAQQALFAQIPAAVGAPGVHLFWRLLAGFPSLLEAVWPALQQSLASSGLARAADDLRRSSFIAEAVGLPSHKAFRGDLVRAEIDADFREKINHFNDLSQFSLSRLLIIAAQVRQPAAHGPSEEPTISGAAVRHVPTGAAYVPPLREGEARGKALEILDRIRREHRQPLLDDYYRSLGRIPDYLSAAWNAIQPIVGDPEYLRRGTALAQQAARAAETLPSLATAMAADQQAVVRLLLDYFLEELLPQTLLDVTLIKALTAGPDLATRIAFADDA